MFKYIAHLNLPEAHMCKITCSVYYVQIYCTLEFTRSTHVQNHLFSIIITMFVSFMQTWLKQVHTGHPPCGDDCPVDVRGLVSFAYGAALMPVIPLTAYQIHVAYP